jgi:hypothetical protein
MRSSQILGSRGRNSIEIVGGSVLAIGIMIAFDSIACRKSIFALRITSMGMTSLSIGFEPCDR